MKTDDCHLSTVQTSSLPTDSQECHLRTVSLFTHSIVFYKNKNLKKIIGGDQAWFGLRILWLVCCIVKEKIENVDKDLFHLF